MNNGFIKVFKDEVKRLFLSPKLLLGVVGVPLLLFLFFGLMFRSGVPKDLPVAWVDNNHTEMSRQLARMLDATNSIQLNKGFISIKEAKKSLQKGDVYAIIVVPKNFEKDIYQGLNSTAVCYVNGGFLLPASLIQKAFAEVVGTLAIGINIKGRQSKGQTFSQAYKANQSIGIDTHVLFNPYSNYNYYLNLGLFPVMFQMVVMMASIYLLGKPFKINKENLWYELGNKNIWSVVIGKLLPYTITFSLIGILMNNFLYGEIGVPLHSNIFMVHLIVILLIFAIQSSAIFFVSFVRDFRSSLVLGGGFSALAFSFSGYTYPTEGFPTLVQYMANVFPFTSFLKTYINTAFRGFPLVYSSKYLIGLGIFMLIGILSLYKMNKVFKNSSYEKAT